MPLTTAAKTAVTAQKRRIPLRQDAPLFLVELNDFSAAKTADILGPPRVAGCGKSDTLARSGSKLVSGQALIGWLRRARLGLQGEATLFDFDKVNIVADLEPKLSNDLRGKSDATIEGDHRRRHVGPLDWILARNSGGAAPRLQQNTVNFYGNPIRAVAFQWLAPLFDQM